MKKIFIVTLLSLISCSNDESILTDKNLSKASYDMWTFPDGTQLKLSYEENDEIIQDENFNLFSKKIEDISKENKIAFVFNGKGKPYDVVLNEVQTAVQSKSISPKATNKVLGLVSRVTFYDNNDYSGSDYSEFVLNSSVNYYMKEFESIYRNYINNIGSGGIINLRGKVSSIKLEGWSEVQLTLLPESYPIKITNHDINVNEPNLSKVKYVKLSDIRYPGSFFLNADNRSNRVIVKFQ